MHHNAGIQLSYVVKRNVNDVNLFFFFNPPRNTVEPQYNDPRYNDIPDITMNIIPAKVTVKYLGQIPDITI